MITPTLKPHKTAIVRHTHSVPARALISTGIINRNTQVLDYGCGRGADVSAYESVACDADGFDPYFRPQRPDRDFRYDVVTCCFVLNVIADPADRIKALRDAAQYLKTGGVLYLFTRSTSEVSQNVTPHWTRYGDGFVTPADTFQRGFTSAEVAEMLTAAGLEPVTGLSLRVGSGVAYAAGVKTAPFEDMPHASDCPFWVDEPCQCSIGRVD